MQPDTLARHDSARDTTTSRVSDISWDAACSAYHGMVAFSGPAGLSMLRVSAPGQPGWRHDRVRAMLTEAGRARGGDRPVRAPSRSDGR